MSDKPEWYRAMRPRRQYFYVCGVLFYFIGWKAGIKKYFERKRETLCRRNGSRGWLLSWQQQHWPVHLQDEAETRKLPRAAQQDRQLNSDL